jgi:large subunit ribosomal protein L1
MPLTHNVGDIKMAEINSIEQQLAEGLVKLRAESKERKFNQTVDIIINLQKFDVRKSAINNVVSVPYKIKNKKICAFLEVQNAKVDTITKEKFKEFNDKKELKKLVNKYDFFMAQASLMPAVATTFGRYLGPAGKMPSPQLGIVMNADDKSIDEVKSKVNNSIKVRTKESSFKTAIGKQDMKNEEIVENAMALINFMIKELPRDKENIKNIELKFTMTKPIKIRIR